MKNVIKAAARNYPAVDRLARRLMATVLPRSQLGKPFVYWYALFLESENWDIVQVSEFRQKLLFDLLTEVRGQSRHYAELLSNAPLQAIADDLAAYLPVMTRDVFRAEYAQIRGQSKTKKLSAASTSGTSGNALQFYHTAEDNMREWAAICHQWRRVGYDPWKSVRAEVRGLVTTKHIVQHFPESNMVRFSVLHLKTDHIRHYTGICQRDGVEFIHGYPSAIYVMAREMLANGIQMPNIRGIMLASEMVYPHQIDCIEAAFPSARIIAHYGNAERVALGAWCEHLKNYHFLPLYSHVEIDPTDGALIGTNLFNTINPFIRYKMSDIVSGAEVKSCAACGRLAMPFAQHIQGRAEDYLFSPEKGWIPPAIVTYPLKSLRKIHEIQFYQEHPDSIELRYTAHGAEDCTDELAEISSGLKKLLGNVTIRPVRCDAFERGASGKLKWIISKLASEGLPSAPL